MFEDSIPVDVFKFEDNSYIDTYDSISKARRVLSIKSSNLSFDLTKKKKHTKSFSKKLNCYIYIKKRNGNKNS